MSPPESAARLTAAQRELLLRFARLHPEYTPVRGLSRRTLEALERKGLVLGMRITQRGLATAARISRRRRARKDDEARARDVERLREAARAFSDAVARVGPDEIEFLKARGVYDHIEDTAEYLRLLSDGLRKTGSLDQLPPRPVLGR